MLRYAERDFASRPEPHGADSSWDLIADIPVYPVRNWHPKRAASMLCSRPRHPIAFQEIGVSASLASSRSRSQRHRSRG